MGLFDEMALFEPPIVLKREKLPVHFWGMLDGRKVKAPCTTNPGDEWKVSGDMARVTCRMCLDIIFTRSK